MSRLFIFSVTVVVFTLFLRPSSENDSKQLCYSDRTCRNRNQICCNGVCNSTCIGKPCRWNYQCNTRQGHKCCVNHCQATCEGQSCERKSDCKDRSLKCCNKVCRKDSCLGSTCDSRFRARDTCGWHRGRRLGCCSGRCEISCQGRACFDEQDCGGWSKNGMKCCDGVCQKSCFGSPCFEHGDCQSRDLDCCGFFENKTCQRSCLNYGCSLSEVKECGRRPGLFCCGDGTCRNSCLNSICFTETFREDCKSKRKLLYCCGMGQKKCRRSCVRVRCEKNEDCGKSNYYCGRPNRRNVSTCTFTHVTDIRVLHDVNLENLEYN